MGYIGGRARGIRSAGLSIIPGIGIGRIGMPGGIIPGIGSRPCIIGIAGIIGGRAAYKLIFFIEEDRRVLAELCLTLLRFSITLSHGWEG